MTGKSAFKEEFVSTGSIDMRKIKINSMKAKRYSGIYLVEEILEITALTRDLIYRQVRRETGSFPKQFSIFV